MSEVSIATANGALIRTYMSKLQLTQRIQAARAAFKKHRPESAFANPKALPHAVKTLAELENRLNALHAKYGGSFSHVCVGAFVTFQNEESTRRCLEDYAGSTSWRSLPGFWCQPPVLRFRGGHRLSVRKAPEPHQVLWHNLELTSCQRLMRRTVVNALVALMLLLSFALIIFTQAQQTRVLANLPPTSHCSTLLPAIAFGRSVTLLDDGTFQCPSLPSGITQVLDTTNAACLAAGSYRLHYIAGGGSPVQTVADPGNANPCLSECPISSSKCTWTVNSVDASGASAAVNVTFGAVTAHRCYCINKITSILSDTTNPFALAALFDLFNEDSGWCSDTLSDYLGYKGAVVGAAFSVFLINIALRVLLAASTSWEGYTSLEDEQLANTVKLFASLVLNTAGLVLLINAALPDPVDSWAIGDVRIFNGKYSDFGRAWHVTSGTGVVLTMVINIVSLPSYYLYYLVCKGPCKRRQGVGKQTVQAALNSRFEALEFEVPVRAAVMLNTLWTCFIYSAGEPLLLPIAFVSFLLAYWVDKCTVLRIARRPPQYNHSIAALSANLMPLAAVFHIMIAVWTLSSSELLHSPSVFAGDSLPAFDNDGIVRATGSYIAAWYGLDTSRLRVLQRIFRENTAPLLLILAFMVAFVVLYNVVRPLLCHALRTTCFVCTMGRCCGAAADATSGRERYPNFQNNPPMTGPYKLLLDGYSRRALTKQERSAGFELLYDLRGREFRIQRATDDVGAVAAASDTSGNTTQSDSRAGTRVQDAMLLRPLGGRRMASQAGNSTLPRLPYSAANGTASGRGYPHDTSRPRERLLTWQTIAATGMLASYDIMANPVYAPALRVLEVSKLHVAASKRQLQQQDCSTNSSMSAIASAKATGASSVNEKVSQSARPSPPAGVVREDTTPSEHFTATGVVSGSRWEALHSESPHAQTTNNSNIENSGSTLSDVVGELEPAYDDRMDTRPASLVTHTNKPSGATPAMATTVRGALASTRTGGESTVRYSGREATASSHYDSHSLNTQRTNTGYGGFNDEHAPSYGYPSARRLDGVYTSASIPKSISFPSRQPSFIATAAHLNSSTGSQYSSTGQVPDESARAQLSQRQTPAGDAASHGHRGTGTAQHSHNTGEYLSDPVGTVYGLYDTSAHDPSDSVFRHDDSVNGTGGAVFSDDVASIGTAEGHALQGREMSGHRSVARGYHASTRRNVTVDSVVIPRLELDLHHAEAGHAKDSVAVEHRDAPWPATANTGVGAEVAGDQTNWSGMRAIAESVPQTASGAASIRTHLSFRLPVRHAHPEAS